MRLFKRILYLQQSPLRINNLYSLLFNQGASFRPSNRLMRKGTFSRIQIQFLGTIHPQRNPAFYLGLRTPQRHSLSPCKECSLRKSPKRKKVSRKMRNLLCLEIARASLTRKKLSTLLSLLQPPPKLTMKRKAKVDSSVILNHQKIKALCSVIREDLKTRVLSLATLESSIIKMSLLCLATTNSKDPFFQVIQTKAIILFLELLKKILGRKNPLFSEARKNKHRNLQIYSALLDKTKRQLFLKQQNSRRDR